MANEKRLIDANALIDEYDRVHIGEPGKARKLIEDAPTVEAVEIVRCRECVHNGLPTCFTCYIEQHELIFLNHDPEFFCGAGERKDGAE